MAKSASLKVKGRSIVRELLEWGAIALERKLSKEEFIQLSEQYPDLILEREKNGKTIIMSPLKSGSGNREALVIGLFIIWNNQNKNGKVYSSSTGIELPDTSVKSPDCAWVSDESLKDNPQDPENEYLTAVPDVIVEIKSSTDSLPKLKKKMTDSWMKNGVKLAWLIDPYKEKAYIYRAGEKVETIEGFSNNILSGEKIMKELKVPLSQFKIE